MGGEGCWVLGVGEVLGDFIGVVGDGVGLALVGLGVLGCWGLLL